MRKTFEKNGVKTNQVLITNFKFFASRKHHTAYVVAEDVLQLEPDVGFLRRSRGDFQLEVSYNTSRGELQHKYNTIRGELQR